MLNCGDAFLFGTDDDPDDYHLWIVVSPPKLGEVVTVCVVSAHKRSERLVVLNQGDHEFITHESVIAYKWSRILLVADIEAAVAKGVAKKKPPMSAELLKKIQNCLVESDHTPNGVRHYFKEVMGL
ncbi:MAG TPA: hypothetical protein VG897_10050 [Terriglobales bacterium]|nr:hypothetical protein [Terriglobales bacterium]